MILLDTNVVSELMKSAPEPAVMVWINTLPGSTVFISAVTQAEILYGVALVPEGKRRDGLARAGVIMGWVGLVLWIAGGLAWLIFVNTSRR